MRLTPRYTREQLEQAVASSQNIRQVCLKLGLRGRGGNYETIRRHIAHLAIDTSHFDVRSSRTLSVQTRLFNGNLSVGHRSLDVTRYEFELAVAASRSIAEVARRVGWPPQGGATYRRIHQLIGSYRLDTTHFKGQGWSRDLVIKSDRATPLEEILVVGRPYKSSQLRWRLIDEGLKEYRCEVCGGESWQGHPIPLELDHINGDRHDNRLKNLRLICPNCHALTDNYRGRNIGRKQTTRPGGEIWHPRRS